MSPRCSIPLEHRNIASSATPRYSPDGYSVHISRMSSGSRRADIAVEPTRSANMTVSWRRSADPAGCGVAVSVADLPVAASTPDVGSL